MFTKNNGTTVLGYSPSTKDGIDVHDLWDGDIVFLEDGRKCRIQPFPARYYYRREDKFKVSLQDYRTGAQNAAYPVKKLKTDGIKNLVGYKTPNFDDIFVGDVYLTKTGRKVRVDKKHYSGAVTIKTLNGGLRKSF